VISGDKMKKIGLFLGADYKGGALQYNQAMLEAVNSLSEAEFQPIVFFRSDYWKEKLKKYDLPCKKITAGLWGRGIHKMWRSMRLPVKGWRSVCPFVHDLSKNLIEEKCDLWIFPSQDAWSYHIPVPALVTIYDLNHRYNKQFPEVSANGVYEKREKNYIEICKWSKGLLVDSNVGKEQVVESYEADPEKIYVLPYIPPKYIYNTNLPEGFDFRYRLPAKYIFYPAQFWEHKNHKNLLKALSMLRKRYPDLSLVFVGAKKNGYESTLTLVQNLGLSKAVLFLGYIPDEDMPELFRRARGMVMPTFFGPTNIPPLEAIALGCPVGVSNVSAMPEQLGDAALYFDPSSVNEIAETVEKLWTEDSLCAELRERGFMQASKWNQSHFNKRLYNIVRNVLGEN
jgi:glycosyltransferase involved in cell wall biosynthesis